MIYELIFLCAAALPMTSSSSTGCQLPQQEGQLFTDKAQCEEIATFLSGGGIAGQCFPAINVYHWTPKQ